MTPSPDSLDDVIEPMGAEFKLPLPLLWQHKADEAAVGRVFEATKSPAGITVRARVERVDEPGMLKDRLDEAWAAVRKKLVALSIGFLPDPKHTVQLAGGGQWFKKWKWVELSLVSVPANTEATIIAFAEGRSAAGQRVGLPAGSRPLNIPPPPPRMLPPAPRRDGLTSTAPPMFERRDDGAVQLRMPKRRSRGRPLLDREPASSKEGARNVMPPRPRPGRKITPRPGARTL